MGILDVLALMVLVILAAVVLGLVYFLGGLPGRIAAGRSHPQADAICALGWLGPLSLGVTWMVAMAWAYMKPFERPGDPELAKRVADLERQVKELCEGGAGS
jgi:hypothetical protein